MTAHSTKAGKAKARVLQNIMLDLINEYFPLGLSQVARQLFPYAVECKNQEKLDLWQAIEQAQINADLEKLMPLLVIKRARSKTYAVLEIHDFMKLAKSSAIKGLGEETCSP
jgi:hypothetical protein